MAQRAALSFIKIKDGLQKGSLQEHGAIRAFYYGSATTLYVATVLCAQCPQDEFIAMLTVGYLLIMCAFYLVMYYGLDSKSRNWVLVGLEGY